MSGTCLTPALLAIKSGELALADSVRQALASHTLECFTEVFLLDGVALYSAVWAERNHSRWSCQCVIKLAASSLARDSFDDRAWMSCIDCPEHRYLCARRPLIPVNLAGRCLGGLISRDPTDMLVSFLVRLSSHLQSPTSLWLRAKNSQILPFPPPQSHLTILVLATGHIP